MSDTVNQYVAAAQARNSTSISLGNRGWVGSGRTYIGAIYLLSAIGLWVFGPDGADRQLLKLFFCTILGGLALIFISPNGSTKDVPEVAVNTITRTIHLVYYNKSGQITHEEDHKIDDLNELSLKNGCFMARDLTGQMVIAIGLSDRRAEREVREALSRII